MKILTRRQDVCNCRGKGRHGGRPRKRQRSAALLFLAAFVLPASLYAHGVEISDITAEAQGRVKVIYFGYSTGDPMMFAKVKGYPPSSPDTEVFQMSADNNGVFAWLPNEEGEWRLACEDGMGHKGEMYVDVAGGFDTGRANHAPTQPPGEVPRVATIIMGLSILCKVFALWYVAAQRRKARTVPARQGGA
jgi:nickel transport protein